MRLKNGYKKDKSRHLTGKWLKRYFEMRTVRRKKNNHTEENALPLCPYCGKEMVYINELFGGNKNDQVICKNPDCDVQPSYLVERIY